MVTKAPQGGVVDVVTVTVLWSSGGTDTGEMKACVMIPPPWAAFKWSRTCTDVSSGGHEVLFIEQHGVRF